MLLRFILLIGTVSLVLGDTPANCTYDDIVGEWTFKEGKRGQNSNIDCTNPNGLSHESVIQLEFPNVATDQWGHRGTWTMIYNQGFEVKIGFRRYFAFSNWRTQQHGTLSLCHETKPGWSHDHTVRDWSCFVGQKAGPHIRRFVKHHKPSRHQKFKTNHRMIAKINQVQDSWTAGAYPDWEDLTHHEALRRMGGEGSRIHSRPEPAEVSALTRYLAMTLPREFDWRNVEGVNYVSPVRNQGNCGSCYSFASAAMLEARYRILTNGTETPVFSPQNVVECSEYSQGCSGGFPYLIAGKYAEDFGMVLESCNPYSLPPKKTCETNPRCRRYYATDYKYVGGYYGACNEPLMRLALVRNGPIAVGFEVYSDFQAYKGGVYHHTGVKDKLNRLGKWDPFQLTNHAVLVVGYGTDGRTGEDYWIVKNSWGSSWGENGFFRIRRGTDECGIESLALEATPVVTY